MFKNLLNSCLLSMVILLFFPCQAVENQPDFGNSRLLSEIFIKRHSGKNFEMRPIDNDQYEALIQSARWAPSSYNDQPWNFIFCDRYIYPEAFEKVLNSIYGQDWVENVPLFVIVVAREKFRYNQKPNEWALYDTGAAAICMSLQASEMGLMAHQIGGFDREEIRREFNIPDDFIPISIIAIGYEAKMDSSEEEMRTRYPLDENFFLGGWLKPVSF